MPPTLPKSCEVEALAEWLRLATVTRVQRLPADKVRPFAESGGREGWIAVAQDLRALVEAKVREAVQATRNDASASCECDGSGLGSAYVDWDSADDTIVSRVLGAK